MKNPTEEKQTTYNPHYIGSRGIRDNRSRWPSEVPKGAKQRVDAAREGRWALS